MMAKAFPNTGVTTGTAADRAALSGMFEGQHFYETDSNKVLVYSGSGWVEVSDLDSSYGLNAGFYSATKNVVSATTSTQASTTGTTFVDSNLSASITPSSASNKILVMVSQPMRVNRNTGNDEGLRWRLLRGGTAIYTVHDTYAALYINAANGAGSTMGLAATLPMVYLDSPNTTSSTTYKTQFASQWSTGTPIAYAQVNSSTASMVLMEIVV